jgi:hypothetical protein
VVCPSAKTAFGRFCANGLYFGIIGKKNAFIVPKMEQSIINLALHCIFDAVFVVLGRETCLSSYDFDCIYAFWSMHQMLDASPRR